MLILIQILHIQHSTYDKMYFQLALNSHGKTQTTRHIHLQKNELVSYSITHVFKEKFACSFKILKYTRPIFNFMSCNICNQAMHKGCNIDLTRYMTRNSEQGILFVRKCYKIKNILRAK